ncbi:MAG: winged helix-turn-helix domain-containing protein [Actinobacteria bacterium]|nr:winged helix-turn-helix domain-containing protein [Actinomycetota bacterium]
MDFRILGPLEVYEDEGPAIELGGRQQRLLLAMLLLHRNEVVSIDRLIDVLWGERPPSSAIKNVQIHVSRMRKALKERSPGRGERDSILQTRGNGYCLEVGSGELDVNRLEELLEDGRRALAAGEPEYAESVLREAIALWRGPPLADFTYESFARGEIARLEELRLTAVEERIEADLALGRHADVTSELHRLVPEHPLRERLRAQLMLALYRTGRKADALRLYEEARRLLAEELGLDPSESLRRLHSRVLADEPALAAPPRVPPRARVPGATVAPRPLFAGRNRVLLGVGGALLLAAALAVAVLSVTRDRTSAGIVSVGPNSLAAIDPETNRVVAEIPVGARPTSVVFAEGSLWVANLDDETVSRIDPKARRVVRNIPTGSAPIGLAGGGEAVWAIGERGVVLRIDPAFNEVVGRIPTVKAGTIAGGVRNAGAVAATRDGVWAISGGAGSTPTLFRVDPAARRAAPVVVTGIGPTAIAVGFGDVWVTDWFESTVSRIEPAGIVTPAIAVGRGASAVAVGEGAVWVVDSLDDAVVRIDPKTNSVRTTINVGRYPSAVAVGAGAVWVANRDDGSVSRIDPRTNLVVETIGVGAKPAGIVVAAGSVWVTNQAGGGPERVRAGGVLRVSVSGDVPTDPALYPDPQTNYATCAKLLNYPVAPAPAGTRLVPEVAASLPARSADGRTYAFTVRTGFAFSPPLREPVTAETFKYSIERSLHPKIGVAGRYVTDIVGQAAYQSGKAAHISGVVANGDKLSITLVKPASDFPARIAMPFFCAVPLNTPIDPEGVRKIPSAGPYYIAEHDPNERIVLKRNPNYQGSRPQRLREIHIRIGVAPARAVADVEAGNADYVVEIPPDRDAKLAAGYGLSSAAARGGGQRYFVNPTHTLGYLALNTSRPLFSDAQLRKAVSYAIDRRALARLGHLRISGGFPAIPTDQYLPPTMPGASRVPLYPPGGDLRAARRLAPDARGTAVLYTCNLPFCRRQAQVIKSNLNAIGLQVEIKEFQSLELFGRAGTKGEPFDILAAHWIADYADPSTFLNVLLDQEIKPQGNLNLSYYLDARLARKLKDVARLSGQSRYRAYAALSVEVARDAAPWVAYATGTSREFFSARIGCQVFQPVIGSIDLAALCIRS